MAEDRMLSDEILLALIKKNGGGGGGGTTNYNDLSNKPQIGGVTLQGNKTASDLGLATETALADKADKSAVKNEFLGTLEEWNALTTEQKKAYDTYQIKGDYTEGSGGLPDYSTTEQKTGQKWIDGKDIYFRTIVYDTPFNIENKTWYTSSAEFVGVNLVDCLVINSVHAVYKAIIATVENDCLVIGNQSANQVMANIKYIIIYYTKVTT
jgi:hypothetical protein